MVDSTTPQTDGQVLTSAGPGSVETGGAGADTFYASQGLDTLTGGDGADLFVFKAEPWAPDQISDFQVGVDHLDLSALLQTAGYGGADPVADHYIVLADDGSGGTIVRFDSAGQANINGHWPNTIIDLQGVSSTGLSWIQLSGEAASTGGGDTTVGGTTGGGTTGGDTGGGTTGGGTTGGGATGDGGTGQVFASPGPGSVESGGAGADTFYASQGGDTLTGGAGADAFVFKSQPWAPDHITDFQVGTDKLDLSALFQAAGYTGSDPVADHYIVLASDGAGGTIVRFEASGQANIDGHWPNTIIDLEHVSPTGLTWSQLSTGAADTGDGTGGATTGGGTAGGGSTGGGDTTGGQTFVAPSPNTTFVGGDGNDTFYASQGADTLTGGNGADLFIFNREPWSPDHITDFHVGADKLDMTALFKEFGYNGSDPVADGYISLADDGHGGTFIRFDHDGTGPNPQYPNTIIDLEGVSSQGLTWSQLSVPSAGTGGASSGGAGGSGGGQVFTAPDAWSSVTGTAGNDTIIASQGGDTLTGGAGADVFIVPTQPWQAASITDFTPGEDKLDLSQLLHQAGYTGSDPVADHYVTVESDGAGGSLVRYEASGQAGIDGHWPQTLVDLVGVAPSQVSQSDWIIH